MKNKKINGGIIYNISKKSQETPKTAYSIQSIAKRYDKSIRS